MLTLIQFPWSPFCITIRRVLERHRIPHRIKNISSHDRSVVVRATRGHGFTIPCVVDGKTAVADTSDYDQEVARYVDRRFKLGLFPKDKDGIQSILARYIEGYLEDIGFRVNDSYMIPTRPLVERVMVTRHKERKFGRGCVQQWTKDRAKLNTQFAELLQPMDNMLASSPYLAGDRPVFVDNDLYGIVGNYLYSGKTKLPNLRNLKRWLAKM